MGLFAQWQPAYAEAGIATFPVDGEAKKPSVGNPLRGGRRASAQWAQKFPDADALGIACGKHNRLTVLDVDSTNENVLADAMAVVGRSPVVARTASGKFHAYYRHNGERRSIRKDALALGMLGPIDILGQGGFAIAPPSRNALGDYQFLEGSLADLGNLPAMRAANSDCASGEVALAEAKVKGEGDRNVRLFDACRHAAANCGSHDSLLGFARTLNESGEWSPLPAAEVEQVAASVWRMQVEGRNGVAGGNYMILPHSALAILETNADALYIYNQLKRHHWGRDFCIANSWADQLPCGPWPVRRLRAARNFLLQSGLVEQIRYAKKGQAALYRFGGCA
ncbi:bifunctional DNA primase/polymerase [Alteriqipengyuania sp. NZ-12B]|uniref:Bifunctional DNA primase/polymerase n=1 Tax=Alteriqipengyuania abyssalis TaxID=2860200 RepID=A0ABS7PDK4_9SPHN|nr:bifunctional DNA primase/polymerase [Alteriqipengyuania abyssalis]MBY8335887.1 bifunctional DNA primase/polymerase [Alteriqipengyuania abyssalis]